MPSTAKSELQGTPSEGKNPDDFLVVGQFRRAHGVRGDLIFSIITDFPERLKPGTKIFIGDSKQELVISRLKPHNSGMIFGFKGINNPEEASQFVNKIVFVKLSDRPSLPEGEYYHHQIIGLNVIDEDLLALGVVSEILVTGANDVYVTKTADDREILIPALKEVIKKVDLEKKTITVRLPDGLI